MTLQKARRWLGIYFLIVSFVVGGYLLLFAGSSLLPLTEEQSGSSFKIIIPVLVGQLALVFQWLAIANAQTVNDNEPSPIPAWAIVLPPVVTLLVFISGVIGLALSNSPTSFLRVSPATFEGMVTFAVTILNATTVLLVGRLFPSPPNEKTKAEVVAKTGEPTS